MLLIPGKDSNGNVSSYMIKLSFRGTGDKAFYDQLKVALQAKAWEKPYNGAHRVTSAMDDVSIAQNSSNGRFGPGIHGLEQMGERHRQKNQEVLGDALADLEALMQRAKDVVKLAESYARHLEREELSNSNGTSAVAFEARKALRQSSEALGLSSSIITKEMAPGQEIFHEELARQVADFLDRGGLLAKEGGVMTLVDLFAIYNRARGISLISPNDLYSACKLLERLRLPIIMRQFKSGLLVVQESYRTPKVIIRNILAWISKLEPWQLDIGVSAQDACAKFGWSLTVAIEELEMAEQYGALCRDEQVSGTGFFENRFVPYAV
jgi:ESCRT-II complex subunit VPS36